jgi:hypothetical protein
MRRRIRAVAVALVIVAATGCETTAAGVTTTTERAVESITTFTLPPMPTEEVPSKFVEGESVAVFGFSLDDHATLWGLPTDDDDAPLSGGSGNFDRQATDLVATGIAKSWDGAPPWEYLEFGEVDEYGNPQYGGYLPQDNVGFLGTTEVVTDEVADMSNERVDDLAVEIAQFFAEAEGLEVVQITQREYGGRELTFDLVGGIDDATAGWRVHIVMEEDGTLFRVVQVERTLFCWFAVDESGSCASAPQS